MYLRPQACATRLIASVAPLVKATLSADGAPMKSATVDRALSYASVARAASACAARWTLEFSCE